MRWLLDFILYPSAFILSSCTPALLLEKILKFSEFERLASHFFQYFQILSIFEPL